MLIRASKLLLLTISLALFAMPAAFSQTAAVLELAPQGDEGFYMPIGRYLEVLPDTSMNLTIGQVAGAPYSNSFRAGIPYREVRNKVYWLRLKVKSDLTVDKQLLSYMQGTTVDLYEETTPGEFIIKHTGVLVPMSQRDEKSRFGHLPYSSILIKKGALQTFYWRVSTADLPVLSPHTNQEASLSSYEYVIGRERSHMFFFIAVCSILFGLALYHLVIFLITKDKVYLYFTVYSMSACLYIMYFKGYLLELIFPEHPALHYTFAFAVTSISFHLALLLYVRQYVDLPKTFPVWDKVAQAVFGVAIVTIAVTSFMHVPVVSESLSIILMAPVVVLEVIGIAMLQERHPLATNYFAAFTLLFAGFITNGIYTMMGVEQGIWDFGDLGLLGLQVLLAVGLALRINLLNKEKQLAQTELIKQLKENQTLQRRATEDLELKVDTRTKEIEEQNEKLTRLNLLKDKLFSIISHDIKGPLNQLSSTLYMMERDMITREEIKQLVPQIRTNLSANSNFINELLTWAKSQLEGAKLNPQSANLQELIDSNFQLLRPIADAKGIQMTTNVSDPLSIYADVEMIKSVVRNLSSNAIKFSNPKSTIEVNVGLLDASFAAVFIKDNGKGISSENQKKLFGATIFTTPGTANEKGTGIGLLLCKDFVEKNGGKIWVESEEGKGSKFVFTIPLHKN